MHSAAPNQLNGSRKTYVFLGGLPRSGSTLLCNVLAQNPRFYTTHTSGCVEVLFGIRNQWNTLIEHKAHPDDEAQARVLQAAFTAYHGEVGRPVIIDKSRGWIAYLELLEAVLGHKAKMIVPVRDIRDVLASFELIWRQQAATGQAEGERTEYFRFQTVEGRMAYWMQENQPVGLAYNRVQDAVQRGFRDRMHFVPFERLTKDPLNALKDIYAFLGEDYFQHNFEDVQQVTTEDDRVHGFEGLHTIRPKIEPVPPRWPEVLGTAANQYQGMSFWADLVAEQSSSAAEWVRSRSQPALMHQ